MFGLGSDVVSACDRAEFVSSSHRIYFGQIQPLVLKAVGRADPWDLCSRMEFGLGSTCGREQDGQLRDGGSGSMTLAFPEAAAGSSQRGAAVVKAVSSRLLNSSFTFGKPNPAHQ